MHDHTILARVGAVLVFGAHKRVRFFDGTEVDVHRARHAVATSDPHLAIRLPGSTNWLAFAVRPISPELDADWRRMPPEDRDGLLYYHLRQQFPDAPALFKAVLHHLAREALRHAGGPRQAVAA
jgi:hypothetical protein